MRHIRDPITGYCIICEKNNIKHFVAPNELDDAASATHGSATDRSSPASSGHPPGKKTIYVHAYPNRSPSPSKKRPTSSLSSSSSDSDSTSANSARRSTALSTRSTVSTSKLVLVDRSPSPSPRNRSPSPAKGRQRSPDVKKNKWRCCKKSGRGTRDFENMGRNEDRCCGYRNFETASYGAGSWGIRRWCAPLIGLLALMALAGIATGIYFGIKAEKDKDAINQQVIKYLKGVQPRYIILGVDQPCNAFNNYTLKPPGAATTGVTPKPNCKDITTKIMVATPKFTPTDPDWLLAYTQASGASEKSLLLSPACLGNVGMLVWVVLWSSLVSLGGYGVYG